MSILISPKHGDVLEALVTWGWHGYWGITIGSKYVVISNSDTGFVIHDDYRPQLYIIRQIDSQLELDYVEKYGKDGYFHDNPLQSDVTFKKL